MTPFTVIESVAASIDKDNIDTDMIIPVQFMKTVSKTGLKDGLFYTLRHPSDSNSDSFILDRKPFNQAQIIISGNNFGCGSSREHAPWALHDFGFRAVVSSEIADIFRQNSTKNGLIPVVIDTEAHAWLLANPGVEVTVDVESCELHFEDRRVPFSLDALGRDVAESD